MGTGKSIEAVLEASWEADFRETEENLFGKERVEAERKAAEKRKLALVKIPESSKELVLLGQNHLS